MEGAKVGGKGSGCDESHRGEQVEAEEVQARGSVRERSGGKALRERDLRVGGPCVGRECSEMEDTIV